MVGQFVGDKVGIKFTACYEFGHKLWAYMHLFLGPAL